MIDILEFSFNAMVGVMPFFSRYLPVCIALGFVATFPCLCRLLFRKEGK